MLHFRVTGLPARNFIHLYGQLDDRLAAAGVKRCIVDATPGYPDRIELRDVPVGERVLLLNYVHQPAANAFRASHAIYVREGALDAHDAIDRIPQALRIRPLSLRAFDGSDELVDAELTDGQRAAECVIRLFADSRVAYIHAHFAKPGCFAARIDRA